MALHGTGKPGATIGAVCPGATSGTKKSTEDRFWPRVSTAVSVTETYTGTVFRFVTLPIARQQHKLVSGGSSVACLVNPLSTMLVSGVPVGIFSHPTTPTINPNSAMARTHAAAGLIATSRIGGTAGERNTSRLDRRWFLDRIRNRLDPHNHSRRRFGAFDESPSVVSVLAASAQRSRGA